MDQRTIFFKKMEEDIKKKRSSLLRITVGLDGFDYRVVNKMALNRDLPLSEVMRFIVHQWIEYNPDLLKTNYGIDFKDITEEIQSDSYQISIDKTLKKFEEGIIKELPEFFELVEDVSIEDLTEYFNVDNKAIKRLIFVHGNKIKKLGLNLKLKEGRIYKDKE